MIATEQSPEPGDTAAEPPVQGSPSSSRRPPRWAILLAMLCLICLVAAVFYPVMGFEFVDFDTYIQVADNPYIRALNWANLKHIFTSRCISSYYPVRTLTFALDYQLWTGLSPGGFKLTNVLIHLTNSLLVFWLALRLLGEPTDAGRRRRRGWDVAAAGLAGGIFAVHPVVVEPVVWIPGREELLMTLGALGTIHFHIGARHASDAGRRRTVVLAYHAGAILFCALGCLSNAVAAVIPTLVMAWDLLMTHRRKWTRMAQATAPLWIIAVATVVTKVIGDTQAYGLVPLSWLGRLALDLHVYRFNMATLFWPRGLCMYYDWPAIMGFGDTDVVLGAVLLAISLALVWLLRRRRSILFGMFWFGLALGPTLQIITHHIHRADRFLYLPLAGFATALGLAWHLAVHRTSRRPIRVAVWGAGLAFLVTLAMRSPSQVWTWRTNRSTWQHCVDLDPNNARVHDALGDQFATEGKIEKAIEHYEMVLRRRPFALETLQSYGSGLATWTPQLRDYGRSIELLKRACLVAGPHDKLTRARLAEAYAAYAYHLQEQGAYGRAIGEYERAIQTDRGYVEAIFNLALLRATCPDRTLRRLDEAVRLAEFAQSKAAKPDINGYLILALVYRESGRYGKAAIATAEARDLAKKQGNDPLAADLDRQVTIYEELAAPP